MEKAEVQAVLELAKQMFMDEAPKAVAAEAETHAVPCIGGSVHSTRRECKAPFIVLYFVFTDCVTINNGACPEWDFCQNAVSGNSH